MEDVRRLVRIAGKVQEVLAGLKRNHYLELMRRLASSAGQLRELAAESGKMGMALKRGWLSAAGRCRSKTGRLLGELSYSIPQVHQLTKGPEKEIPRLSTIVDDLNEVQREFGSLDFDKAENTVSVVIEPVTLEDIYLGPFKIQLELDKLSGLYQNSAYRVIALDPNPAATDDQVTHPHISGEKLCEGDGCAAIRASLEQGRLSDFFTMVRSILNTYSPDSPYVSLQDWDGRPCYDCGYTMNSEDVYFCQYCDHDYCGQCSTYCRRCEETVCLRCSAQCSHCEEMLCRNCVSACETCGELFCGSCLEDDLCPNCKEETEKENERQETEIKERNNTSEPEGKATDVRLAG